MGGRVTTWPFTPNEHFYRNKFFSGFTQLIIAAQNLGESKTIAFLHSENSNCQQDLEESLGISLPEARPGCSRPLPFDFKMKKGSGRVQASRAKGKR